MNFTLVAAGPGHIRYLAEGDSTVSPDEGIIQLSGAGNADVAMADAVVAGPLAKIIQNVVADQAAARLLVLDDGLLSSNNGRAVTTVMPRGGQDGSWSVDANADGENGVEIEVSHSGSSGRFSYVEILYRHSLTQS